MFRGCVKNSSPFVGLGFPTISLSSPGSTGDSITTAFNELANAGATGCTLSRA